MKSFRNSRSFAAVLFALLFAVTLWSAIPVGYMADVSQDGFKVVICDSDGPVHTLTIGADGQPVEETDASSDEGVCVFGRSLGDTALGSVSAQAKLYPPIYATAVDHVGRTILLPAKVQGAPLPARGPPFHT